jgi:DNA-binding transcriptional regulator YiaG
VTAQHHREIANLKGQVDALKRQVIALERQARKVGAPPQASAPSERTRFIPKGLVSTRKRLGLSAADLAKMMGVSAQTIYNWERGATKPRADQQAKLASLRHVGKRQVQAHLTAG